MDCPTCGRTLRVPQLDGSVEPVPDPKLDLQDASLADALNKLAMIGQDDEEAETRKSEAPQVVTKPEPIQEIAPLPPPKPVTLEAPLPAEPVIPKSTMPVSTSDPETDSSTDPLASLARQRTEESPRPTLSSSPPPVSHSPIKLLTSQMVLIAMAVVALVAFGAGYFTGGALNQSESSSEESTDSQNASGQQTAEQRREVILPTTRKTAVAGQITFKSPDGRRLPDVGARVLVFPEKRSGKATVAVAGFWANAEKADFRISLAGLREMNGDATVADEKGRYEIHLPESAGSYHVLIISQNLQRDEDETVSLADRNLLAGYLDRPDALLKQLRYKLDRVQYTGTTVETLNHSFE